MSLSLSLSTPTYHHIPTIAHSYPILYAFLILPQSVIRWLGFIQEYTGNHTHQIPPAATFAGRFIYGLSGLCNVILFLKTRPELLLMTPPPQSRFRHLASPTLSLSYWRPRWEDDDDRRFAALGAGVSLGSGERQRASEERNLGVRTEELGCKRTSSDGGRVNASKDVQLSSLVELGVQLPNGQRVLES
jgi:hypothetical protein